MKENNSPQPPGTRVDEDSKTNENKQLERKRKKSVRFTPGTLEPTTKRVTKRRKRANGESSSNCDPSQWYTREELKDIHKSVVLAVQVHDCMSSMWPGQAIANDATVISGDPRFSSQYRERCKLVRSKMYETIKNVKDFEIAQGIKVPPELLSEHLRIFSKPMEMDAAEWASNTKKDVYDPATSTPMEKSLPKREDTIGGLSMIGQF